MEISAKLTNSANALASTKIPTASINEKVNELAKQTAKKVRIDGFRPGKAPVAAVLKRYKKELEDDAKNDIFRNFVDESLKILGKEKNEILGEPIFSKYEEKDGIIDVEMKMSFRPEVKIEGYEKFIPEFATPRVTKKEIDEKINEFLLMIAPLEKSDKKVLEKGDFAKFDFEGFVDDKPFDGGKAQDYVLEIGSGRFIPGFEDGMLGMKIDEERDIKVKFPENYQAENLAGKDAIFKVKLHEIQCKKIGELDDKTLKRLMPGEKEPSKEKFEAQIKEQIRADKMAKLINEELKPKFADTIVENFIFDMPEIILEQEIDLQFRNAWGTFSKEEIENFRKDKDALTKKRDEFRDEAVKSVKMTFLIDEIAKDRKIQVSDQELVSAVYMEAYRYGMDPKKHLEEYRTNGYLPVVKMALLEEKLFNDIFSKDKKSEKTEEK